MRNRFLGDRSDLVKYDLLLSLVEGFGRPRGLTVVWMLLPDNGPRVAFHANPRRPELSAHVAQVRERGEGVEALTSFFAKQVDRYCPYGDTTFFTHEAREAYFRGVPSEALRDAVVFLDADNGMAPLRARTKAEHFTLADLRLLRERLSGNWLVVLYQHLPVGDARVRAKFVLDKAWRAALELASDVSYVTDWNRAAFLLLGPALGKARSTAEEFALSRGLAAGHLVGRVPSRTALPLASVGG